MVSVSSDGDPSDENSISGVPSFDGDSVAFASAGRNLVAPDPTPAGDDFNGLFIRDSVTGLTSRVDGFPGDLGVESFHSYDLSTDGRWIAYSENEAVDTPRGYASEVFLENLTTRERRLISTAPTPDEGDPSIDAVSISADGSEVGFDGYSADSANGWHSSIWLYTPATGVLRDAMQYIGGSPGPMQGLGDLSMSADGTTIAFAADEQNLEADPPAQWGAFPGDSQMFVMSTAPGALPHEILTPDGSLPNFGGLVLQHSLSADGRYLGFDSVSTNWTGIKPGSREIFDAYVTDLTEHTVTRLTDGPGGQAVGGFFDGISADGNDIVFESDAGVLVPDDTNNTTDVFLWRRGTGAISRLSVGPDGEQLNQPSTDGLLAGDGEHLTFLSGSGDVVYGSSSPHRQVFETTLSGASPNLTAAARSAKVDLAWSNPASNFRGVVVRGARGNHAPSCLRCGFAVYRGTAHAAASRHLRNGHVYSYSVFTRNARGRVISRKTAGAKPHGTTVLGSKRFAGSKGKGWGHAHPSVISTGRSRFSRVSTITWRNWGATTSIGWGLTLISRPHDRDHEAQVRIELKAQHPSSCSRNGQPAYTELSVRLPSRPGGKLGSWHSWFHNAGRTICGSTVT
jgi:Tol biopolymer transport system component